MVNATKKPNGPTSSSASDKGSTEFVPNSDAVWRDVEDSINNKLSFVTTCDGKVVGCIYANERLLPSSKKTFIEISKGAIDHQFADSNLDSYNKPRADIHIGLMYSLLGQIADKYGSNDMMLTIINTATPVNELRSRIVAFGLSGFVQLMQSPSTTRYQEEKLELILRRAGLPVGNSLDVCRANLCSEIGAIKGMDLLSSGWMVLVASVGDWKALNLMIDDYISMVHKAEGL